MDTPIPMLIHCPMCRERHIDRGLFQTQIHHTHACQGCGHVWRPAIVATVGVEFLPGFKNEEPKPKPERCHWYFAVAGQICPYPKDAPIHSLADVHNGLGLIHPWSPKPAPVAPAEHVGTDRRRRPELCRWNGPGFFLGCLQPEDSLIHDDKHNGVGLIHPWTPKPAPAEHVDTACRLGPDCGKCERDRRIAALRADNRFLRSELARAARTGAPIPEDLCIFPHCRLVAARSDWLPRLPRR